MPTRHAVLLKFKKDVKPDVIQGFAAELRALPTVIPNILTYEVGLDLYLHATSGGENPNCGLSIAATFPTDAAYLHYATHAKHVEVVSRIKPLLDMPGARTAAQIRLAESTGIAARPGDVPLVLLFCYFIFSCVCIESKYCHGEGPMDPTDSRFMMPETYAFSEKYNPLFLARPEWLRLATCFSAYGFLPFHVLNAAAFIFGITRLRPVAFLFAGVKLYALCYYHTMEALSDTPPPGAFWGLGPYWYAEGPYLVALTLLLWRMRTPTPFAAPGGDPSIPTLPPSMEKKSK